MKQALLKLHISVFLAGFTGILGKAILLNEGLLTWYRIGITVVSLFAWMVWKGKLERISPANVWRLLGTGALIALHWVCFYGSIKAANVSIGLVCFASVGLFTALLEPMMTDKKFSWQELGLGTLSLLGIYLIFHFDDRYRTGILLGLASAVLGALFSVLNKRYVEVARPQTMMVYELSGGLAMLSLLMPVYLAWYPVESVLPSLSDWVYLLILAWLCTILAMDLMLQALKKISAFTQNLTLNLEPVYGIAMAFIFFQENRDLKQSFYVGMSLIALSVVWQMLRVVRKGSGV
ncbi:DMT family transporter [Sediminibacterium soli]|uniref:DMT family transporter n=1 Tax=Sediminibacterium soli TaxID=2698829 RepID=UPI00137B712F|nr:DMT family transporter [Sediminibacterium soli]NCI46461.1 EamA family transporter [Sediminibacterium soli]